MNIKNSCLIFYKRRSDLDDVVLFPAVRTRALCGQIGRKTRVKRGQDAGRRSAKLFLGSTVVSHGCTLQSIKGVIECGPYRKYIVYYMARTKAYHVLYTSVNVCQAIDSNILLIKKRIKENGKFDIFRRFLRRN